MCKYNDVSRKISPKAIDSNCFRAYLSFFVISRVTFDKFIELDKYIKKSQTHKKELINKQVITNLLALFMNFHSEGLTTLLEMSIISITVVI